MLCTWLPTRLRLLDTPRTSPHPSTCRRRSSLCTWLPTRRRWWSQSHRLCTRYPPRSSPGRTISHRTPRCPPDFDRNRRTSIQSGCTRCCMSARTMCRRRASWCRGKRCRFRYHPRHHTADKLLFRCKIHPRMSTSLQHSPSMGFGGRCIAASMFRAQPGQARLVAMIVGVTSAISSCGDLGTQASIHSVSVAGALVRALVRSTILSLTKEITDGSHLPGRSSGIQAAVLLRPHCSHWRVPTPSVCLRSWCRTVCQKSHLEG